MYLSDSHSETFGGSCVYVVVWDAGLSYDHLETIALSPGWLCTCC